MKKLFKNKNTDKVKIFWGNWEDGDMEAIFNEMTASEEQRVGIQFIFASYEYEDYSGSAFVVYVKDGVLYEVNGGHCSCNGLEGLWEPEETSAIALLSRPNVPEDAKKNLKLFYKNTMCFL